MIVAMNDQHANGTESSFKLLRRLAQVRAGQDRCELCSAGLAASHRHLLETNGRRIVCACDACALRFQSVVGGRFKLIPRDARVLPGFRMTDARWDGLSLPINLAFFFQNSATGRITALYPSPAGATESLLSLENWKALAADNPSLTEMEPDVEALLANRVSEAREYFVAPMDRCYELVGLIRAHWRGLSGGDAVWEQIGQFFAGLREQAGVTREFAEADHA
jgi:hypothetical protein